MELTVMILGFHMLNFKPAFSLSSFTLIKRLFSSSLSAFRVVSSAYMRLSIFLQTIFILACVSSNLAFCISAYKLNKQGESLDVWYRFLRRQVRWSDFPIPLRICHSIFLSFFFFFHSHSETVWIISEADTFLEFLHDPTEVGNLISGSSAYFKSSLYIWKISVHILLKPSSKL